MIFREIAIEDFDELISFWKENYFINEMDTFERFKLFLEKNPSLNMLAKDNGKIVA